MSDEAQLAYHRRRLEELKVLRAPWEALWRELADYIEPTRLRLDGVKEGAKSRAKIVDSTGTLALRTLTSGMHSGITSPARAWFRLTVFDEEIRENPSVKLYLEQVEARMRDVFQASNIYPSFHVGYGDLALFGQSCALLVEDEQDVIRMQPLTHGTFWLARDGRGVATTLYRVFSWSVGRIVERFGLERVSSTIRGHYERKHYDKVFEIAHAIEPRSVRDVAKVDKRNKKFLSNYWEVNGGEGQLLEESGFDENPIIAPSWEIVADDHYSVSPSMVALGDIKMLQHEQKRKWEAIDKLVRPPMVAPASMRGQSTSLLPGAVTYVEDPTGRAYRPAIEMNLRLNELAADIGETQRRIERALFADLFLMLENMDGVQPRTTFEIAERKEEKLLALGPVLENVYNGQLDRVIERTYAILARRGELPVVPQDLAGAQLKVEYVSMLAQAQKAVSTGAIERVAGFVGSFAASMPQALDKFNVDRAINKYVELLGAPSSILVSDEDVAKVRQERAQQMAQAQQMQAMGDMIPAVKQTAEAASVMADVADSPSGAELLSQIGIG